MEKKALAENIHAKLFIVMATKGTASIAAVADIEADRNSKAPTLARISDSTLPATSAKPAVLNKRTSDLAASMLNARIINNA